MVMVLLVPLRRQKGVSKGGSFFQSSRCFLMLPLMLGVGFFLLYPMVHAFISSLWVSGADGIRWADFAGYRFVFRDRGLRYSLVITVLYSFLTVAFTLWAASHIAVTMAESRIFRRTLLPGLFISWVIPVYIAAPLWRAALYGSGGESLFTALFGIRLPIMEQPVAGFFALLGISIWSHLPVAAIFFFASLRNIPKECIDASRIDGCNTSQRMLSVYLPLLRRPILVMGFLGSVMCLTDFSLPFMLTGGGPPLLQGITGRYIIGATTTVEVFLYRVFQGVPHYTLPASVGVLIALMVGILLFFWYFSGNPSHHTRQNRLRLLAAILHLLPFIQFSWIFALLYFLSRKHTRVFTAVFSLEVVYVFQQTISHGFLEGFHPAVFAPLIALAAGRDWNFFTLGHGGGFLWSVLRKVTVIMTSVLVSISAVLLLFVLFWLSFSSADIASISSIVPPFAAGDAYRQVISNPLIWQSMMNSLLIGIGTAGVLLVCIIPAGVFLSDKKQVSDRWVSLIFLISVSGGIHTLVPLLYLLSPLGLLDTVFPVILVYASSSVAVALMIFLAYIQRFPNTLRDVSLLEGTTSFQWIRYVIIPLSLPAIGICAIIGFLKGFSGFQVPLVLIRREELYPVSLRLFSYAGDGGVPAQWSLFAVLSLIQLAVLVPLLFYIKGPVGNAALREYVE